MSSFEGFASPVGNFNAVQQTFIKFDFLRGQHILPSGFMRIRHYGILSSRNKSIKLNHARSFFGMKHWEKPEKVAWQQVVQERMNFIPEQCPKCKEGVMKVVAVFEPQRGPPFIETSGER